MPNSEYLRLKALLDSNPQYKIMLNTISKAEGTWGKDAYSTKFGGSKSDWKKGKDKTIIKNSSAHGKYQFMNDTWKRLADSLGMSGFSPEEQDVAALKLLEEKNALKHIDNGEMDKAIFAAAPVWAALPKDASGKSAMSGQKAKPLSTVLGYTKSNEAARAAVNDGYKKANEEYQSSDIQKEKNQYLKEIRTINAKKISESEKNAEKHLVKQKYYREGKLLSINQSINEDNKEAVKFNSKIHELQQLAFDYNNTGEFVRNSGYHKESEVGKLVGGIAGKVLGGEAGKMFGEAVGVLGGVRVADAAGVKHNTAQDEMNALAKELGIKLVFNNSTSDKVKRVFLGGSTDESNADVSLDNLVAAIKEKPGKVIVPIEKGILKYGKTKNEYDAEVTETNPVDDGESSSDASENTPDGSTNKTPEQIAQEQADAQKQAELDKKNGFDGTDILSRFNDTDQYVDTPFQFSKGKQEIPFDALIGLTAGLTGAAQADAVEIKYRDEQIAEGMLQYAQDLEKIKNIGLDPAIEGSLKQKLADAYQTGLQNTVRASNGNRNLVLGNQGQLDKARMEGIVGLVAMDIDRSDKALAAFGEVQKYINDFETNKSIANDERRYQEDQKKQMAGMQLASAGMGNFIDAIQNAKENGPGSMNDMKRQYFQFAATGLLPNAEEGKPGSLSHRNAVVDKNKLFTEKKRTYRDWINSKNQEDRNLIAKILDKNPQWDPTVNKSEGENATKFEDLEKEFNAVSGTEESRLAYFNDKGISVLDASKAATATSEVSAADKAKIDEQAKLGKKAELTTTGTPIIGGGGATVPVVGQKQVVPDGTIITKDNLADKTKLDQLNLGANGLLTGPETISDIENTNALNIEEYNFLNKPQ